MTLTTILTPRQHQDMQTAILEYLKSNGLTEAFQVLCKEAKIDPNTVTKGSTLERKWSSIIRLQKKISDLENKIDLDKSNPLLHGIGKARKQKSINLENIRAAKVIVELKGHQKGVTCFDFHPSQNLLISGSDDTSIKVWDLESGSFLKTLKGHTMSVTSVKVSDDLIVSCSADLSIKIWDMNNDYICTRTMQGHDHTVSDALILKSLGQIVTVSRDCSVRIWDLSTGFCVNSLFGHSDWVRKLHSSENEELVASCANDKSILLWNTCNWTIKGELRGHDHVVESVLFLPESANARIDQLTKPSGSFGVGFKYLASASRDKTVKIWDLDSLESVYTLSGHGNWVKDLCVTPDGAYLISVGDDKTLRVWNLETGKEEVVWSSCHQSLVNQVNLHHSLPILATASLDKSIKLWQC